MKLVKNYDQVYKSYAVWFPIIANALYELILNSSQAGLIPDNLVLIVTAISGILGWVIEQPNIRKGRKL